jgi:hypothetical protein
LQLSPPKPRKPQPQKLPQQECPHEPQLLVELRCVSQPSLVELLQSPQPDWHPWQLPPLHVWWPTQSVSVQHSWQVLPLHRIVPEGQSQPASLLLKVVLHAKSQWPSAVHVAEAFCGTGHGVFPQPSVQPASGLFALSWLHSVPHL